MGASLLLKQGAQPAAFAGILPAHKIPALKRRKQRAKTNAPLAATSPRHLKRGNGAAQNFCAKKAKNRLTCRKAFFE
ncbi:hypothetical protein P3B99_001700 [Opitutia bacterium KCR 482]|nr:hypothetical protein [Opitutae bacterium KCR 482]